MKTKKTIKLVSLTIFAIAFTFVSCDPGHSGESYIHNESSYSLYLKYKKKSACDTISITISPYSSIDLINFGGLGSGRYYDCCPCEFSLIEIKPTDTTKILIKDIGQSSNWTLTNPNKRRFSKKDINCDFIIKPADIQ